MSQSPLDRLRANLTANGLSGVVVPRFDPYQGEVVSDRDARLRYLTGFTGSAGIALVLADRAVLFVDGRYQVQVKSEVDLSRFEIAHFFERPIDTWLAEETEAGTVIGINAGLVPHNLFERIRTALESVGGRLVALDADPVDAIWPDQPAPPLGAITAMPVSVTGETSADKRKRLAATLRDAGTDFLVETQPDNVAWLLNVRGRDIAFTPLPHSTLLLDADGAVDWFVDSRKLPNDLSGFETEGVTLHDAAGFAAAVEARAAGARVWIDPDFAPASLRLALERGGGMPHLAMSPITTTKAVKNATELAGMRAVHVTDGIAVTEFLAWLDANVAARAASGAPVTELEAQARLLEFRRAGADFVEDSFAPISAAGSNAAMCHYTSKPETDRPLDLDLPYLIDSGGQYPGGTTDVTRTIAFGPVADDIRAAYTAVLKGFIALVSARFPKTACGHHLDALARRPLWDLGLDYDHGTGHGVGHFLGVHEHPHRFGKTVNNHPFAPGVVMTVEPGYYAEGKFGLRVENQVEVVAAGTGFLAMQSLTLVPIDLSLADKAALTPTERNWLRTYHDEVTATLAAHLSPQARTYLQRLSAASAA